MYWYNWIHMHIFGFRFGFTTVIFTQTDRNYHKVVDSKNINLLITFILYFVLAPDVLRGKEDSPQILEDQTEPRSFHPSRRHSKSQYTLFFFFVSNRFISNHPSNGKLLSNFQGSPFIH